VDHQTYMDKVSGLLKPEIKSGSQYDRILYLTLKLTSEIGELAGEICKREFHKKNVTQETILNEYGDGWWYIYNLINEYIKEEESDTAQSLLQIVDNAETLTSHHIEGYSLLPQVDLVCRYVSRVRNLETYGLDTDYLKSLIYNYCILGRILKLNHYKTLEANINKLEKRHGTSYNASFYTSKEDLPASEKSGKFNLSDL